MYLPKRVVFYLLLSFLHHSHIVFHLLKFLWIGYPGSLHSVEALFHVVLVVLAGAEHGSISPIDHPSSKFESSDRLFARAADRLVPFAKSNHFAERKRFHPRLFANHVPAGVPWKIRLAGMAELSTIGYH